MSNSRHFKRLKKRHCGFSRSYAYFLTQLYEASLQFPLWDPTETTAEFTATELKSVYHGVEMTRSTFVISHHNTTQDELQSTVSQLFAF